MRPIRGSGLFLVVALSACGQVLPPDDAADGAISIDDAESEAEGGEQDIDMGEDADASEGDALHDVSAGDAGRDVNLVDVARDVSADIRLDASADARDADADVPACPAPVDCAIAACNGAACGANGRVCASSMCTCPGGQTKETTCGDGADNDCDGLSDCADPDCLRVQCGASTNQRCCGTTCVDTETDPNHCQGCGTACAAGQMCRRISDAQGTRGTCTCNGANSNCARSTNNLNVCRLNNPDGLNYLCACNSVGANSPACAEGQTCVDVAAGPNFCRY
jgi:hypothetical protein